jgi:hypothetical protein
VLDISYRCGKLAKYVEPTLEKIMRKGHAAKISSSSTASSDIATRNGIGRQNAVVRGELSIARTPKKRSALKHTSADAERRDLAFTRSVAVLERLRDQAAPEVIESFASHLESALQPANCPDSEEQLARAQLVESLTGGEAPNPFELATLEAATLANYFAYRAELMANSLSATEVARLLGTSRQTPHDRARSGSLLAETDKGGLRFPAWQFDPQGPAGVVAGLSEVVRALSVPPLSKISWFVRPNPYLEGRTPLETLKQGEITRVVQTARAVGIS